jgi:hypothetical protein
MSEICGVSRMKLAILFWFYKEPQVCENRLQMLRKYNPSTPIYGLYGGDPSEADRYRQTLGEYLDDFYVFDQERDKKWKWLHGDLMIADWYSKRGIELSWDTVVVVQWDMLVFGPIHRIFSMLRTDQILLSGLRPVKEVAQKWDWVSPDYPDRQEKYFSFLGYVKENFSFDQEPMCCLFIVVCLPRSFLEKYSQVDQPELGFLEYRVPMYAQIFQIPFCVDHSFDPWWDDIDPFRQDLALRPVPRGISRRTMLRHLLNPKGSRVFHPYFKRAPISRGQLVCSLASAAFRRALKAGSSISWVREQDA